MRSSLEITALRYGLLAALLSLGGAGLAGVAIQALPNSILPHMSSAWFSEPVVTPEMVAKGHEYYDMSCSHCHGDDASGDDDGPNLHDLRISNARIGVAIKKGIKGQMPNFAQKYNDKQIAALVGYLRTLQ